MAGGSSNTTSPPPPVVTTPPSSPTKDSHHSSSSSSSSSKPKKSKPQQFSPLSKADIVKQKQEARAQQQAKHTAVISLTVKNTNKILKEIGFRRSRLRVSFFFLNLCH